MAVIDQRGDKWRVRVRKGNTSRSKTFKRKADAVAWATQMEADIEAGRIGSVPNRSFGELLTRYAKEVSVTKKGARWEQLRIELFIREYPALCETRLPDLGPEAFAAWRDERLKSVSQLTVRREWAILMHACNIAIKEWRWLTTNPISTVKKPDTVKARARRPTENESDAILLACGYRKEDPPLTQMSRVAVAWLFAIETAMRAGEICRIRLEEVDFVKRLVHIPTSKNGHSRDVPLSREAIRLLKQVMQATEGKDTVFDLTAANLDALFRRAKEKALVEDLHFHDSRREALTRMARKLDVMTLAKVSGHRDLRILQNTYYAPNMEGVASLLD
ncbi:site-specific integrase [Chromobacterium phragmitis]|uniref:tyrosine-type recombinase/integrase n=1 Tax=Chromobacterium amazonense TaxID=1382803 RepID=UPI0021B81285|nr:site-specific integrase [Chromobacterium amazonense]MBM2884043.1 site-specific integrase [Chromobacterium amazonense]